MKGIYSDVLICIEEAFWDYLFLCTIYILACVWKSREGPLSWRARHRNWGWGHVEHALGHAKWQDASTHTHLHSGWLLSSALGSAVLSSFIHGASTCPLSAWPPLRAVQDGIGENGIVLAKCSPSLHLSLWEACTRFRTVATHTHFLHKLHMAVAALHIHQGALCQSDGSVPHITAGWHSCLNTAWPYRAAFPALCLS